MNLLLLIIAAVVALVLCVCFLSWFGRPRKRVLRSEADKINAAIEIIQVNWDYAEEKRWAQFHNWYPEISEQEIDELKERLRKIRGTSQEMANIDWMRSLKPDVFQQKLAFEYPELNIKSLKISYRDAIYFTK